VVRFQPLRVSPFPVSFQGGRKRKGHKSFVIKAESQIKIAFSYSSFQENMVKGGTP